VKNALFSIFSLDLKIPFNFCYCQLVKYVPLCKAGFPTGLKLQAQAIESLLTGEGCRARKEFSLAFRAGLWS